MDLGNDLRDGRLQRNALEELKWDLLAVRAVKSLLVQSKKEAGVEMINSFVFLLVRKTNEVIPL